MMLLFSPPHTGGYDFLNSKHIGRELWVPMICVAWLSWFVAPFFAAVKLQRGRVPWAYLVPVIAIALLLSFSESLGLSTAARRIAMHAVFEPALLVLAVYFLTRYTIAHIKAGEDINFLCFAVLWMSLMLGLKLLLMLDHNFLLKRWPAHYFYYVFMLITVGYYIYDIKAKPWDLFT
jgi:hypothetical protein